MDQYIGKMLDNRYEIIEVVGVGGMAVVYKALCHRLNRYVAVKILKEDVAADPDLRRRFRDESQAVAMLSHPNIVSVYDVSKTGVTEYIVMELIDGITLKQYIAQKGGRLPWKEALHFTVQIMRALRHAHGRGIIHRDIKPHNIMVLRDGSVKVADFGIARLSNSQNTMTQQALGSVHYISPEQARGSRIDARSDVYSAGVVLYEMLTGKLPYEGDSAVAVAIQHINSVPTAPSVINPSIPRGLEEITMKAMASDPDGRYADADAMLKDLDAFRKDPAVVFGYGIPGVAAAAVPPAAGDATQYIRRTPGQQPVRTRPNRPSGEAQSPREQREGEERHSKKKNSALPYIIGVSAVVFIFALAVVAFAISLLGGGNSEEISEIKIPNVCDMTYSKAVEIYGEQYEIVIESSVVNDNLPAGTIIDQDPAADKVLKVERPTIQVIVTTQSDSFAMPTVIGMDRSEAVDMLMAAGIPVGNITLQDSGFSDDFDEGQITTTDPAPGQPVTTESIVTLYVSQGPAPITVPSFLGQSRTVVQASLKELGLLGTFNEVFSDEPVGVIISQSIDGGTEVEKGEMIVFEVSKGPEETEPPVETTPPPETTAPEETTKPSPEPSLKVDKTISIKLPEREGEVTVKVDLAGSTVYGRTVDCAQGSIDLVLSGSGSQLVEVYFDGTLDNSFTVNFS